MHNPFKQKTINYNAFTIKELKQLIYAKTIKEQDVIDYYNNAQWDNKLISLAQERNKRR